MITTKRIYSIDRLDIYKPNIKYYASSVFGRKKYLKYFYRSFNPKQLNELNDDNN
jgi:hypothetical protein